MQALDSWIETHPYLRPVADLQMLVDRAVELFRWTAPPPPWSDYRDDFHAGIPLLRSSKIVIDLSPVASALPGVLEEIQSKTRSAELAEASRNLSLELRGNSNGESGVISWLLDDDTSTPAHPGLFQYAGWALIERYLRPIVQDFSRWRDDERWLRGYCPTCGSLPAMAHLVGVDPGRYRFLVCGRCRSHWRFRRIACPFCRNVNDHRLAVLSIESEGHLRIDYCDSCGSYIKTYDGEGNEAVMLADWSSLHLDLLARDRGLKRAAASMYEL